MKRWQTYLSVGLLICGCLIYASDSIHANGSARNSNLEQANQTLSELQTKIQENGPLPELVAYEKELKEMLSDESETMEEALARKAQELAESGEAPAEVQQDNAYDAEKEYELALDREQKDLIRRYEANEKLSASDENRLYEYLEFLDSDYRDGSNPLDDTGGPDAYGYVFEDNINGGGIPFSWIELCGDANAIEVPTTDDNSSAIAWGFAFPYYGTNYSSGWVNSNGMLAFGASSSSLSNLNVSNTSTNPWIAGFWDDLDPDGGGSPAGTGCGGVGDQEVFYRDFGTHLVVSWTNTPHFSESSDRYNFQIIIFANGQIKLQYNTNWVNGTTGEGSSSIHIEGNGTNGLSYLFNGAPAGRLGLSGRAILFTPPNFGEPARCCYLNAGVPTCVDNLVEQCDALNGVWSPGVLCVETPCPIGRCCYDNGNSCADNTSLECAALGGSWTGGTTCVEFPCPITLQGSEDCVDAVEIPNVPGIYSGTTAGSLPDVGLPATCGTSHGVNDPGIWYSLTGTGNSITLSLCDPATTYDSKIFVFCGECAAPTCIDGDDDDCTTPSLASTLTFCSALGTEYFILVSGFSGQSGPFKMTITDDGVACNTAINCNPEARCCYLDNGVATCVDNLQGECLALNGQWTAAATCASAPCPVARCCYLDNGLGACLDLTQLECNALSGTWSTGLSCVTDPCPTGRCCYLDGRAEAGCATNTALECAAIGGVWTAGLDCETTPCPVARCCYNDGASCTDNTELECDNLSGIWTSGSSCATNPCPVVLQGSDECLDAIPAVIPGSYLGTTVGSTSDAGVPATCGTSHGAADPGVWYTITGTGNTITVSLCDPLTTYDSKVFVFCGTCDGLTCVDGDDDDCVTPGLASTVTFCSQAAQTYFVLVSGFIGATGQYLLSLSDDGVACNTQLNCAPEARCCYLDNGVATCANLLQGDCNNLGGVWTQTTTCENQPCPTGRCCYLDNGLGTCAVNTQAECTQLAGQWTAGSTCDTPCPVGRCCYLDNGIGVCADNIQVECTALGGQWTSGSTCAAAPCPVGRCCYLDGETPACADVMQIECTFLAGIWNSGVTCDGNPCPEILLGADLCEDAVSIPSIPANIGGTTVGSTPEVNIPVCGSGYNVAAPGVWYSLLGTGNTITVSLCDPLTSFDSELFVFCGECDLLACLDGDDDDCTTPALASTLSFCSQSGATYKILVTAFSTATGTYAMNITDDGSACEPTVICVVPCDPVLDLTIYNVAVGGAVDNIRLTWTAPQLSDYRIYSTTDPNNDGNPDGGTDPDFTVEETLLDLPAGPQSWEPDVPHPLLNYKNYVVTAICGE